MKEAVRRILSAGMASTSGNQEEELTKGMVSVVEYMLKMRDREALIDKASKKQKRTPTVKNG